ncbi:SAC3/GANP/Nin1/mts3/eIF-3 p25 family-domain-containing protein [Stachybotrys elegans]|uniref:SAC3/GANP/Nin1/mts3/eIF-3 p25 family-domain-containing protein n=1 Tax=Stachybotrys elegans TaxID=80388 RepID=A0A8K0SRQ5_9HYPO|nr:SAC3/GANP/Nin1/mts3/eIF-3 p25 family-domain-containing protein [Stachybotrys elegans]
MFSPFSQAASSSTPVANPFAPKPQQAAGNPFGFDGAHAQNGNKPHKPKVRFSEGSDTEGKRKAKNPFAANDGNTSDGGWNSNKRGDAGKKKPPQGKKPMNGFDNPKKPQHQGTRQVNGFGSAAPESNGDHSAYPSSADNTDTEASRPPNMNDPHARKVYEQLRKDGVHPPPWPSQPGNPTHKAEMAKFREKYESYRDRVRASLTKAGLIDDPDKRKTLEDAIDFKGICEDMCPEYEKITRITEADVHQPEKDPKTTFPNTARMIKKLARSAAGQEAPLPMDVRSIATLRRTLDYLIDKLLQDDGNLPVLHGFLWDRTRAIRRDFTFFSSMTPDELQNQIYVLENITRFHVTALHLLSQEGMAPEDFVEQQELEQLGKALLSLRDVYDDCNAQGITCKNEAEFRAYYLVFHANDPNILETVQSQWGLHLWKGSDEIRTAVSLVEGLQNTHDFHGPLKDAPSLASSAAYSSYLRIMQDPKVSYTMACFAECHLPQLRRSILRTVKRSLARPKETPKDVTATVLNDFLQFDTVEQAIEFAELHDMTFAPDAEHPSDIARQYLVLNNRQHLPHHRLQHQFSHRLVEKKRGSRSLPDLIHQTVFEEQGGQKPSLASPGEGSLFVPQSNDASTPKPSPSPFTSTAAPSFGFSSPTTTSSSLGAGSQAKTETGFGPVARTPPTFSDFGDAWISNPFGQPNGSDVAQKPTPSFAANPFASATAQSATTPSFLSPSTSNAAPNPFASATPGAFAAPNPQQEAKKASPDAPNGTTMFPQPPPTQTISTPSSPFSTNATLAQESSTPASSPPPVQRVPPRDLLADFTKWFVEGDDGILQDFQDYILNQVVLETFQAFEAEQRELKERQEQEENNKKADDFHRYNVSLKFFYRWKRNAREKRLRSLRRSGREQFRLYHEARRAAELEAAKAAAEKEALEQAQLAELDRPQEFKSLLNQRKPRLSRQQTEEALLESGVLFGVDNEREAVASIVAKGSTASSEFAVPAKPLSRSRSGSSTREGSKTRALREQFLGGSDSSSFRHSLPSMSSRFSASTRAASQFAKTPVRWRLKAMGLVQLPDGTAVPDNLVGQITNGGISPSRLGSELNGERQRRASIGYAKPINPHHRSLSLSRDPVGHGANDSAMTAQKRKRATEDDGAAAVNGGSDSNKSKRLLSEAQEAIRELRALRMELEEDTAWFKNQNEKLQSEGPSRATTP